MYEDGYCNLHESDIPSTLPNWNHRLCTQIELNKHFEKYILHNPLEKLFERFEKQLEENVLYEFPYNVPSAIKRLRIYEKRKNNRNGRLCSRKNFN